MRNDPLLDLQEQLEREAAGQDRPMPLPWTRLNFALGGGLRPGTFSLLVGEPGSAKTYIALAACLFAYQHNRAWAYWPLERDDAYAARRLLAVMVNRWSVLDPDESQASAELMGDPETFDHMARITQNIEPNPRQMVQNADGRYYIPDCQYRDILERLRELCEGREFVVLDPLSMLTFDDGGRDAWKGQENFAKDAAAIAAQTGARLLIVHHTRKAAPGGRPRQAGVDEVAGAAALSRFADNVIFLEHNPDGLESDVIRQDGTRGMTSHKRTLFIAKARDGRGTGWRIACDLGEGGPELREHGLIQRKGGL